MPDRAAPPIDADRLGAALALATRRHGDQRRKGTAIPYVSHLLQVAGLVLEHGGGTDLAVAALLHDVVEDTDATLDEVVATAGPAVAAVVADLTDVLAGDRPDAKSPWQERKASWLERAATMPTGSLLVAACDKRHNLGVLVADVRAGGPAAISPPRFSVGPDRTLWFHRLFLAVAGDRLPPRLTGELTDLVDELAARCGIGEAAG